MLLWWRMFRAWLWTYGVPLPALPGWEDRVAEWARATLACEVPFAPLGAPVEWSLVQPSETPGRLRPYAAYCAVTGRRISGASSPMEQWGVRCARCGVPLHVSAAGMKHSFDIPRCGPCTGQVRAECAKRDLTV